MLSMHIKLRYQVGYFKYKGQYQKIIDPSVNLKGFYKLSMHAKYEVSISYKVKFKSYDLG